MNYYLLTYCLHDGDHTYFAHITTDGESLDHAFQKGKRQEHWPNMPGNVPRTMFDFGDGLTRASCVTCQPITDDEMVILDRLGIAHFYFLESDNNHHGEEAKTD